MSYAQLFLLALAALTAVGVLNGYWPRQRDTTQAPRTVFAVLASRRQSGGTS